MFRLRRKIYIKVYRDHFASRRVGEERDIKTACSDLSGPRTLLGDWRKLEKSLFDVVRLHTNVFHRVFKPIVLIHLIPKFEGGYTSSELRLFQELGQGAGAHFCLMCEDSYGPLSNKQIHSVFKLW